MLRIRGLPPLLLTLLLAPDARGEAQALPRPLPVDQAFALEAAPDAGDGLALAWSIAEGYHLYHEHLAAKDPEGAALAPETPTGVVKDDPTFGPSEVSYEAVTESVDAAGRPGAGHHQGCQEDGLCYPPMTPCWRTGRWSRRTRTWASPPRAAEDRENEGEEKDHEQSQPRIEPSALLASRRHGRRQRL
jgi:thiol:disulfide interchange protein